MCPENSDILIVGAGPAGLAVASYLVRLGHRPLLLERGAAVGAAWRGRSADLRLTTTRRQSSLPYYGMEPEFGRWPSGRDWSDYLDRYVIKTGLDVRLHQEVISVERNFEGWTVSTNRAKFHGLALIIASGEDCVPVMPNVSGLKDYGKPIVHASDFAIPPQRSKLDVLVIGAGTSGCEIASLLSFHGHKVWLSVRRPPVLLPRHVLGIPMSRLGHIATYFPEPIVDAFGHILQSVVFGRLPWSGRKDGHRLSERKSNRYAPSIDNGIAKALKSGAVQVLAPVSGFGSDVVRLEGGFELRVDLVVAATGYHPQLQRFVKCRDVLDATGRPLPEEELRVRSPNLYFVGLRPRLGPLLSELRVEARRVAFQIDDFFASKLRQPSRPIRSV